MSELRTLEFSIAPVQSFVGQARRTRDYWAGSYLLSFLTAHAMRGVSGDQPDLIRFPHIKEDLLWQAVNGRLSQAPLVASLPNRFTAECEDPAAAGRKGEEALQEAWRKIADAVWGKVREILRDEFSSRLPELSRMELPDTWKNQLFNLWEVYWVDEGPDASADWGAGMERRKNWRKPLPWEEQGEMCTVCGERVVAFGAGLSRAEVRRLWHEGEHSIRKILDQMWNLVLEDNDRERLCSVCLVKRVFPYIAKTALGWDLDPKQIYTPTTHEFAKQLGTNAQGEPVNPYYAVLLMDGDKLGQNLREHRDRRGSISEAITAFSRDVPGIVEGCSGRVVYAGGDDVLAFLPLHTALCCAAKLRKVFINRQVEHGLGKLKITISAAILMVHMMSPMQPILRTAHRLLDEVAKDGVGRDAFVLQIQKRSGPSLTIAKPWHSKHCPDEHPDWLIAMKGLSGKVFQAETETYSRKFLHAMKALLEPLSVSDGTLPFDQTTAISLMASEYLSNRDLQWEGDIDQKQIWEQARRRMERLYQLGLREKRSDTGIEYGGLQTDVFEILHFLAGAEVKV
jgi:CRISPR-associated protein Cmr2